MNDCIRDLKGAVIPASRRWHKVDRKSKPPIFTVDVFPNKSYKLSCHVESDGVGELLILRRVHTHKVIDRDP